MSYSKLPSVILGACALAGLAAPRDASAAPISLHPTSCVLQQSSSPFASIAATYTQARFMNTSGAFANALCPIPLEDINGQVRIFTTSTATNCHIQAVNGSTGAVSFVYGSRSNNHWTFTVSALDPGSQSAFVSCALANNTGIYHLVSY